MLVKLFGKLEEILLGLLMCQKDKHRGIVPTDFERGFVMGVFVVNMLATVGGGDCYYNNGLNFKLNIELKMVRWQSSPTKLNF